MKKLLLSGLALTVGFSFNAQVSVGQAQSKLSNAITSKKVKMEKPSDLPVAPLAPVNQTVVSHRNSMVEVPIGTTVYDLQSNYGSVGNRVKLWDDNTISAVWTIGIAQPSFSDRGTGYNYFNGTNWGTTGTVREETIRTGWPNVVGTASSGEYIVNHGTNPTNFISRATKGSGAWTEAALGTTNFTWPRAVVGGANGNTVHVIGNENTGAFYMKYSRSTDGGATWVDENITLPDFATLHFEGSVDAYDVDARGDVVAIVMGGWNESLTLWKSMDNGATWTHTTINEFPLAPWDYVNTTSDVDGDGVADTIITTDGGISCVIDNNNMVHVAVGAMRVLGETAGSYSYFPGTDGLLYWNENMGPNTILNNVIAAIDDIDGSGTIEIPGGLALYQCSLTGMPTLGVDAQNNIHLAYSSIIENTTNGNADPLLEEAYRNVYYMYTTDNGANWALPTRIEPSDFDEQAWPSMAKRVNECIHLTYHKDGEPGNTFQPSESPAGTDVPDPYGPYDVIYNCITNPVGLSENQSEVMNSVVYPNPVQSVMNFDFTLTRAEKVTINLVDVLGKVVYSNTLNGTTGINNVKINVKNFASGLYSLNTVVGGNTYAEKVIID